MSDKKLFETDILWRILDVTRELSTPIELDDMLVHVVDEACDVLNAERATVFLYDRKTNELFAKVGTGLAVNEIRFPISQGIAGRCASTLKILNVIDAYSDKSFNREIDKKGGYKTRCLLSVPLVGLNNDLVGVLQVINQRDNCFSVMDEKIAEVFAAQCAVALQRAQLLHEYIIKQKIQHDLFIARDIQQKLLPTKMPELKNYDLAGWNEPADETGGDIFDAISLDQKSVLILLADASGHGLGPAVSVIQFRSMVRIAYRLNNNLCGVLDCINNQMIEDLAAESFITAFAGTLDVEKNTINYHACGQAPLLHFHKSSGEIELLPASTLPLGIIINMPLDPPTPIEMQKGDIFAIISDGIFEQENLLGEQFGLKRTIHLIRDFNFLSMNDLAEKLHTQVMIHADKAVHDDDMTIVFIKRNNN